MESRTQARGASPFLKWAGGKRWLVVNHPELFKLTYNHYYEPFLGSGAVYFKLQPQSATISDSNVDLVNAYTAIRDDWETVYGYLKQHHVHHNSKHYYEMRSALLHASPESAARFIYLNRTCWNGLYRVNKNGEFNVPIGTKSNIVRASEDFRAISNTLKGVTIEANDFGEIVRRAKHKDLIFADPPYTITHNNNSFVKYNERIFSWADQQRLFESLRDANKRGVYIIATNANHQAIRNLYQNDFDIRVVHRNSLISSSSTSRGKYEELIITNNV